MQRKLKDRVGMLWSLVERKVNFISGYLDPDELYLLLKVGQVPSPAKNINRSLMAIKDLPSTNRLWTNQKLEFKCFRKFFHLYSIGYYAAARTAQCDFKTHFCYWQDKPSCKTLLNVTIVFFYLLICGAIREEWTNLTIFL